MRKYWSKLCCLKGEWVTLCANFRGKGFIHQRLWRQKTRVLGLSRGVVCVILRLAVLIQYRRVTYTHTHTHTDRQTHDDGYYPSIASAARLKSPHSRSRRPLQLVLFVYSFQFKTAFLSHADILVFPISFSLLTTNKHFAVTLNFSPQA